LSTGIGYPGHSMFGGNAQYVARPEHYWMCLPESVAPQAAAAAMASGQAAAAEGLGRRHPHELLGSGTSARHARAEEIGQRKRNRRLGARPRCNSFANPDTTSAEPPPGRG